MTLGDLVLKVVLIAAVIPVIMIISYAFCRMIFTAFFDSKIQFMRKLIGGKEGDN